MSSKRIRVDEDGSFQSVDENGKLRLLLSEERAEKARIVEDNARLSELLDDEIGSTEELKEKVLGLNSTLLNVIKENKFLNSTNISLKTTIETATNAASETVDYEITRPAVSSTATDVINKLTFRVREEKAKTEKLEIEKEKLKTEVSSLAKQMDCMNKLTTQQRPKPTAEELAQIEKLMNDSIEDPDLNLVKLHEMLNRFG